MHTVRQLAHNLFRSPRCGGFQKFNKKRLTYVSKAKMRNGEDTKKQKNV